ncbi:MAG: TonB-dependent receptor [Saprospirales bacterium]|nr:TonB-dependent receptor [Saprospirales bacterium]
MKQNWAFVACMLLSVSLLAQTATQTVRGTVVDKETKAPLLGANVVLVTEDEELKGTTTDFDGIYVLEKVPVGRRAFVFSYTGYEPIHLDNIVITSGKEVILNIEMTESSETLDSIVVYSKKLGEASNVMAAGSSVREFNKDETELYAGSRGDPPRMASNFAGVQGADDTRNDIVIRGNTPQGLLWRLEGVNIPNPNHFAISGTAGGPITILNNKYLADSDFFTGAFPAEFGNGIAGVFDLRMRNGNDQHHEFSAQLGFLGTELSAEGPISKEKRSSYLLSYRYSTLRLFDFMGIPTGTGAVPKYQDGAFRVNFRTKQGGNVALWGIGGYSRIDIKNSELKSPKDLEDPDKYAESDRDQVFNSRMGVVGLTYTQPLGKGKDAFLKATFAASSQVIDSEHWKIFRHVEEEGGDSVFVLDSLPPFMGFYMGENKYSAYFSFNKKLSRLTRTIMKVGLNTDYYSFTYVDSFRTVLYTPDTTISDWRLRWNTHGKGALLVQPYVQFKRDFGEGLSAMAGLTSMYFSLNNNSFSPLEPRLGLAYEFRNKKKDDKKENKFVRNNQRLSFGYGLHSQIVPPYIYFFGYETKGREPQKHNYDLSLFKSHHLVLGYDWSIAKAMRLKLETYYQYLFNIPVEKKSSAFSLINTGSGFDRLFPDTLVNEGTARNYGFEATLERFFSGGYYFLITGSVFDSKYRGSDDTLRNTTFNGRLALNGVIAKEFTFKGSALNIGAKLTYVGGRWRGLIDREASDQIQDIVFLNSNMNTIQLKPYFRADLKASLRWNRPKVLHEFSIDLVNVTNYENLLLLTYVPGHPSGEPIQETYQLGFLPIFYYKLDFSLGK